jgi:hypothetical protein
VSKLVLTFDSAGIAQSPENVPDGIPLVRVEFSTRLEGEAEVRSAAMSDFERIQGRRRGLLQLQDDKTYEGAPCPIPRMRSDDAAGVRPNTAV